MEIRQSVKVINAKLERHGEAGIVEKVERNAKGEPVNVDVKFDTPDPAGALETFKAADLTVLQPK